MKPLVLLMRNIFDVGLGENLAWLLWSQHDILRRSTHSLSTTTPLAIGVSFFSIVSLLTSNKIKWPWLANIRGFHYCSIYYGKSIHLFSNIYVLFFQMSNSFNFSLHYCLVAYYNSIILMVKIYKRTKKYVWSKSISTYSAAFANKCDISNCIIDRYTHTYIWSITR